MRGAKWRRRFGDAEDAEAAVRPALHRGSGAETMMLRNARRYWLITSVLEDLRYDPYRRRGKGFPIPELKRHGGRQQKNTAVLFFIFCWTRRSMRDAGRSCRELNFEWLCRNRGINERDDPSAPLNQAT